MFNVKRFIAIILTAAFWMATAAYAAAAPAGGFKTWPRKATNELNKIWSIKFNMPLDPNTVNSDTIYVTDQNGNRINVRLSLTGDKKTVKVTPAAPYAFGKQYNIYITSDVTSANGTHLAEPITVPFMVTDSDILSVDSVYTPFITKITVATSSNVYKVTVNSQEMHYDGNNTYSLGISGLKPGDIVTIQAYDVNGKLIESIKHSIK